MPQALIPRIITRTPVGKSPEMVKPFYPQTVPQKVEISASFAPTLPHFVEKCQQTNRKQILIPTKTFSLMNLDHQYDYKAKHRKTK